MGQNVTDILVPVGSDVTVCANGVESGLSRECTTVTPAAGTAIAVLELVRAGRVEGVLQLSDGTAPNRWSATVSIVNPDGSRGHNYGTFTHPGDGLSVGLLEPGDYEIDVIGFASSKLETATLHASVSDGDVIDFGTVPLGPSKGRFGGPAATGVTVWPREIVAGDSVTVRVAAHNGGDEAVSGATLSMQVPDGTSAVSGSVVLDGAPVASTTDAGWLDVSVGNIGAGETAVLQAWLETDTDFAGEQVVVAGRINYEDGGPVSESVGLGAALVRQGTIDAPRITDVRTLRVSGRAPAGSAVSVTADGVAMATTETTPGGLWQAQITLPETPLPRVWSLVAEADTDPDPTSSAARAIRWDENFNPLQRVVVKQDGGASIEFSVEEGVARFPFVWIPSSALDVRLFFKDPDRVDWAVVSIGTSPAGRSGAILRDRTIECFNAVGVLARRNLCYWEATLIPLGNDLGEIYFAWDSEAIALDLSPTPLPPPLTEDEVRALLRPPFNSFTDLVVVDEPSGTDISAALDALEVDLNVTVTSDPGMYTPTAEDVLAETATGVPIYGLATTLEETDEIYEVRATFFIPDSPQADPGVEIAGEFVEVVFKATNQPGGAAPKGIAAFETAGGSGIQNVAALSNLALATNDLANAGLSAATNPWDVLEEAADNVFEFCTAEVALEFQVRIDQIVANLKIQFGVSVAAAIIGLATGPIGAVVLALVGFGLDQSMADIIGRQIEGLIDDMFNHPSCSIPPKPRPPGDKYGNPTWIFDPSGFSFELFEDVRLEGVTATVQAADTADGPWSVWDAEWYLQENPQVTDPEGRYGWDVPVGWWRVRFDLDGYETAYSDALEVLPPHFDVNVPLTSLSPPVIGSSSGFEENSFVEVVFENFVLSDWVNDFNVAVTDSGDNPVPVVMSAVGERTTGEGDDVAAAFRFDTGSALTKGDTYTVCSTSRC